MKIAFDIGGTTVDYIIELNNKIENHSFLINDMDKDELLNKIAKIINAFDEREIAIGISTPTAVDLATGYCNGLSGIRNYANFNLYDELKKLIKSNCIIRAMNDANAALLGILEHHFPKKPNSALMISLGTGIGGAIYINGSIFSGVDNMSGEIGYPVWRNNLNVSECLSPVNVFKRIDPFLNGKQIFNNYFTDEDTCKKLDFWFKDLATFISMLSFIINPEVIVFTGGVTKNSFFQEKISEAYNKYLVENNFNKILSTKLKFFDNSNQNYGVLGARKLIA